MVASRTSRWRQTPTTDGATWATPVAATWENVSRIQTVELDGSAARFIRMTGVSSCDDKWIACGEFVATERSGEIESLEPTEAESSSASGSTLASSTSSASPNAMQSVKVPAAVPADGTSTAEGELPETGPSAVAVALSLGLLILAAGAFLVARSRRKHMPKRA